MEHPAGVATVSVTLDQQNADRQGINSHTSKPSYNVLLLNIKLVLLKLLTASGTIVSPVKPAPPVASRGVCPLSLLLTNGENCEHIIHREAPAEGRRMMYEVQTDKRPT